MLEVTEDSIVNEQPTKLWTQRVVLPGTTMSNVKNYGVVCKKRNIIIMLVSRTLD